MMTSPEYLYHYTNIDSLAYILRNKKFQFSSLDNVNDLREGFAKDFGDLRKYVFVNCWTEHQEEQLPLWNMYTQEMRGVRLKLKLPILKSIENSDEYLFPEYMIFTQQENIHKIIYTDDNIELSPSITTNGNYLDLNKIGKYKKKLWYFESEWRYILIIIPLEKENEFNKGSFIARSSHLLKAKKDLGFKKYYRPINNNSFQGMEITLGPRSTESDRIIVESLVEKYNPSAKIYNSNIKGDIR